MNNTVISSKLEGEFKRLIQRKDAVKKDCLKKSVNLHELKSLLDIAENEKNELRSDTSHHIHHRINASGLVCNREHRVSGVSRKKGNTMMTYDDSSKSDTQMSMALAPYPAKGILIGFNSFAIELSLDLDVPQFVEIPSRIYKKEKEKVSYNKTLKKNDGGAKEQCAAKMKCRPIEIINVESQPKNHECSESTCIERNNNDMHRRHQTRKPITPHLPTTKNEMKTKGLLVGNENSDEVCIQEVEEKDEIANKKALRKDNDCAIIREILNYYTKEPCSVEVIGTIPSPPRNKRTMHIKSEAKCHEQTASYYIDWISNDVLHHSYTRKPKTPYFPTTWSKNKSKTRCIGNKRSVSEIELVCCDKILDRKSKYMDAIESIIRKEEEGALILSKVPGLINTNRRFASDESRNESCPRSRFRDLFRNDRRDTIAELKSMNQKLTNVPVRQKAAKNKSRQFSGRTSCLRK